MKSFQYIHVTTPEKAVAEYRKHPKSKYIAGGTNLVDLMKRGVETPEMLIDISSLSNTAIKQSGNKIVVEAMALNSSMAENDLIKNNFPLLAMAINAGASPQLRNMATAGGNLLQRTRCPYFYDIHLPCNKRQPGSGCSAKEGYNRMHAILGASEECIAVHPSDMCVALAALDATVNVQGSKGKRTIAFSAFHRLPGNEPQKDNTLEPGELILSIDIPMNQFAANSHYLKIRDRASYAFALVSVAAAMNVSTDGIASARIALGGVAHKPWRATNAEEYLKGKRPSKEHFQSAAKIALQDARGYGDNDFKIPLAVNAIEEALSRAAGL